MNIHKLNPIIFILAISLFLNLFGIGWGLPDRWHPDEHVAQTLQMIGERKIVDFYHPPFYKIVLAGYMVPFLAYFVLTQGQAGVKLVSSCSSWIGLVRTLPDFATNIYLVARSMSALFAVACVYLTHRIGKAIYNEKVGLFSAMTLAATMGFVGRSHLAKEGIFVTFLVLLVLLLCISSFQTKEWGRAKKYFLLACLFGGFSLAAKYDGGIAVVILAVTFVLLVKEKMHSNEITGKVKTSFQIAALGVLVYMLGLISGWPGLLSHFSRYKASLMGSGYAVFSPTTNFPELMERFFDFAKVLLASFGLPFSLLILSGLFAYILKFKKQPKEMVMIIVMMASYFLVAIAIYNYASIRFVIISLPLLAIFAGLGIYALYSKVKFRPISICLFTILFVYSLAYTLRADLVFVKKDTRYECSQWIVKNIPKGASIEITRPLYNLFSSFILDDYEVIFCGTSSQDSGFDADGFSLFYKQDIEGRKKAKEKYFAKLNQGNISVDYIIHSSWESRFLDEGLEDLQLIKEGRNFLKNLFEGKFDYRLLKTISYPESLFWNPRPNGTCPTIYVFKKEKI
ncbi:MAG: glycosyltransferase family 39 protein [Candidatus Omnitrophica bacterium]|nr:glycosyltransferase family 39 protein [Candidatus Omnitrophota bacterium]